MELRITHIVESLDRGGLERVVLDLITCQVESGYACQIICIYRGGVLVEEAKKKGVKCIILGKRDGLSFSLLVKLRKAVILHKSNIIHTHNALAHYYAFFSLMLFTKKCFINTRHGMAMEDINSRKEKLFKLAAKHSHYLVSVCDAAKKVLVENSKINSKKCVVVHNGIQLQKFINPPVCKKNNVAINDIVIGSVGRLNWAKDYFTLLDAFEILVSDFDNLKLVIVGGGELEKDLKDYTKDLNLQEKVLFKGDMSNVEKILKEFDIYAMSSVTEGYSISLLEACAVGLPIVATDVGGNSEIVRNCFNGFIVPAKDKKRLSEKIKALISDPDLREKYSVNSYKWARDYASSQTMHKNYLNLYMSCFPVESGESKPII